MPKMKRPSAEQVEHRGMGSDDRRVLLGQVDDAGAELDLLRALDQGREEDEGRGDLLGFVRVVLADIDLGEAELVRQDDRLLVLAEHGQERPLGPVQRHHEHAEFHGSASRSHASWAVPAFTLARTSHQGHGLRRIQAFDPLRAGRKAYRGIRLRSATTRAGAWARPEGRRSPADSVRRGAYPMSPHRVARRSCSVGRTAPRRP